jgi:uncharacterized protein (TIGR02246 family)
MKKTLLIAVIIFIGTFLVFGQKSNSLKKAESEILKINQEYDKAIISRDAEAYERILADDFIFTDYKGNVSNKRQEIEKVRTGDLKFQSGKSDDVQVKIYGKTAVVTGRFTAKGQSKNQNFTFVERYTAVFVKRNGRWQMVAEQSTEIAQK